jgi:REP element-mobilizing transposase RayT
VVGGCDWKGTLRVLVFIFGVMTVRRKLPDDFGVYFVTFTCYNWLPLFADADGYDLVYKWFDFLKAHGSYVAGYVIMPNHVHAVIAFCNNGQSINTRVGNGKRFMAYGIVERLRERGDVKTLALLRAGVNATDRAKGKLHEVFEPSFDCKECVTERMLVEKMDYIHANPCSGIWRLADCASGYVHSSAGFYEGDSDVAYGGLLHYLELYDVDLSREWKG